MNAINTNDIFIWTEVFNCGEIGRVALDSFLAHHPALPVHVYGYADDLVEIADHPQLIKITFPNGPFNNARYLLWRKFGIGPAIMTEDVIRSGYAKGHLGTARLWAYLIAACSKKYMIHFDSDVIFLGPVVQDIIDRLQHASLVGQVRNYRNNPYGYEELRYLPDISQTACFGFDRSLINSHHQDELIGMCMGSINPRNHPVIDFFDAVMFEILANGGTVDYLPHDEVGGCGVGGSRTNAFSDANDFDTPYKIDFGSKLIHFSAVGSGLNFHRNPNVQVAESYKKYALDRYALFAKTFLNKDLGFDLSTYTALIAHLARVDTRNWTYQA